MPVYQDAVVFLGVAITLGFLLVLVVARTLLWRRSLHRRLLAMVTRMADDKDSPGGGVEGALARLERAADETVFGASDATIAADRLRLALGELPIGLVVCDEQGNVVYRNAAAKRQVWPRDPAATAAMAPVDGAPSAQTAQTGRTDPELAAGLSTVLSDALAGRRVSRPIQLSGPPRRSLRLTGVPLDDGRRAIGAVVVVEDLSEEHRQTTSRRDLLADLARELTEPLLAVSLLAEGVADEEDPVLRRRLLDKARSEATRTRRLVDQLLDLGRTAAEERRPTEAVDVAAVATRVVERAATSAQVRLIGLELAGAEAGIRTRGEPGQVERAITKLVDHAVSTARAGAKLGVTVRTIADAGTHLVEIEVCDAGAVGASARPPGIAFAIVEQAARNLGGTATVVTDPEIGTRSTLRLPAVARAPHPVAPSAGDSVQDAARLTASR